MSKAMYLPLETVAQPVRIVAAAHVLRLLL